MRFSLILFQHLLASSVKRPKFIFSFFISKITLAQKNEIAHNERKFMLKKMKYFNDLRSLLLSNLMPIDSSHFHFFFSNQNGKGLKRTKFKPKNYCVSLWYWMPRSLLRLEVEIEWAWLHWIYLLKCQAYDDDIFRNQF